MGLKGGWIRGCGLGLGLMVASMPLWAQNTPEDEYKDLIRVSQDIQPLGDSPFGADISLLDGSLSFRQTDVSAKGRGLPLSLTRVYRVEDKRHAINTSGQPGAFGDWDLSLPRLQTMTVASGFASNGRGGTVWVHGWQVATVGMVDSEARCSRFEVPPSVLMRVGDSALSSWQPRQWWKGYHLVVPGQGSQDMLANVATDKAQYPVVTKNHWPERGRVHIHLFETRAVP